MNDIKALNRKIAKLFVDCDDEDKPRIYEGYSGRGMFGKASVLAFTLNRGHSPGSELGKKLIKMGFAYDNLGMGWIYYLKS